MDAVTRIGVVTGNRPPCDAGRPAVVAGEMMTGMRPSAASALAAIGDTPVFPLRKLVPPGHAEVWLKLESGNPTGSYKDRMALAMIEGAERRGDLKTGMTVVEFTGGSTGSSLAFVCAVKGYRFHVVSSDAFSMEKLNTMRAFGAELEGAQLTIESLDTLDGTWRGLLRMQESGVFGGFGPLRSEFGHGSPYPLATLAIDEEVVEEKRWRTHPELAPAEDES